MKLLRIISEIKQSSPSEIFRRLNDYFWNKIKIDNAHLVHTNDRGPLFTKYGFKGGDIPQWFETLSPSKQIDLINDYKLLIKKWQNKINNNLEEIRQGPTPEMVDQLDSEIWEIYNLTNHPKSYEAKILRKKYLEDYGWSLGHNIQLSKWFGTLPPQKLTGLYNEMKRIKKYLDDNAG